MRMVFGSSSRARDRNSTPESPGIFWSESTTATGRRASTARPCSPPAAVSTLKSRQSSSRWGLTCILVLGSQRDAEARSTALVRAQLEAAAELLDDAAADR